MTSRPHADDLARWGAFSVRWRCLAQGTWFRGFDYSRWEIFGSNADWGWPAFGIETGCESDGDALSICPAYRLDNLESINAAGTVTWITAALGLHELPQYSSFW